MSNYSVSTPINVLWNKFTDICDHCLKLIPTKQHYQNSIIFGSLLMSNCSLERNNVPTTVKNRQIILKIGQLILKLKRLIQQECRKAFNNYVLLIQRITVPRGPLSKVVGLIKLVLVL